MSNKNTFDSSSRRAFLVRSALIASTAIVAREVVAEPALPLLSEDDPIAVALGYAADATKVDVAAYPKRGGTEGAKQFCSNCSLYQAKDNAEYGKCAAIPGKLVAGAGWCNAWIPG